jgi:hypothetical protein
MSSKKIILGIVITMLLFFSTACSVDEDSLLGKEVFKMESLGFEFKAPLEYSKDENTPEMILFIAPEGTPALGPVIVLQGTVDEMNQTNEEFLTQVEYKIGLTYSEPEETKVDKKKGLSVEISSSNGSDLVGRLVVVVVSPTQGFYMWGGGTSEKWATESKVFDQVLKSIKFFEPIQVKE